ncbi:hypothetical protein [Haliangium ochraceum]|uniref:Uncharacterized protein n=1 Tax=Haliangium ochraceum (strain DSM 14365 / JCM 11303 / SMP-2) TaxID=502025 RepID=D0LSB2_HALO1|nr:hypothetical protein [Haliangium ochraceum]ACY15611.1 conserved hypothetical protein [Haliangium ochraceum DSM 14365]
MRPLVAVSALVRSVDVAGQNSSETVAALLDKRVLVSETPYATRFCRLTPSIDNAPDEVEAALRAVRELA